MTESIGCFGREKWFISKAFLCFSWAFLCFLSLVPNIVSAQHSNGPINSVGSSMWTILVYVCADNNLESAGIDDINEMERGFVPNRGVTVVAQFDRIGADGHEDPADDDTSNGDWTTARRYVIKPDDSDDRIIRSYMAQDLGEVDSGSVDTVVDFVKWGLDNFPAKNTMLIMWDHGEGWSTRNGGARNDPWQKKPHRICYDDTFGTGLTTLDMAEALRQIYRYRGNQPLELLGFDACLMQMLECAYEYRNFTQYIVASEESEPNDGWPYDDIVRDLCANPGMGPQELGQVIVQRYDEFYRNNISPYGTFSATQSCIRTQGIYELKEINDTFWYTLARKFTRNQLMAIRNVSQCIDLYENYGGCNMSLPSYARQAKLAYPNDEEIKIVATALENKLISPANTAFGDAPQAVVAHQSRWPIRTYIYSDANVNNVISPPFVQFQFKEKEEFKWVDKPLFFHSFSGEGEENAGSGAAAYSISTGRNGQGYFYRIDLQASPDHSLCPSGSSHKIFTDTIEVEVMGLIEIQPGKRIVTVNKATTGTYYYDPNVDEALGLAIFFPKFTPSDSYFWPYRELALAKESLWFIVLQFMMNKSRYDQVYTMDNFALKLKDYSKKSRGFQNSDGLNRLGREIALEAFLEHNHGDSSKMLRVAQAQGDMGGFDDILGEFVDILGKNDDIKSKDILERLFQKAKPTAEK